MVSQMAGATSVVEVPSNGGPWPTLSGPMIADNDADGMGDDWEKSVGLSPGNPNDHRDDRNGDGYTNLEEYLHHRHLVVMAGGGSGGSTGGGGTGGGGRGD